MIGVEHHLDSQALHEPLKVRVHSGWIDLVEQVLTVRLPCTMDGSKPYG
jgi:hypothetical protein